MKRIDITYGGEHYSIGGVEFEDLQREVVDGLRTGAHWLTVNDGEGAPRVAHLLLTPGVPLAIIPIPGDSPDVPGAGWDDDAD